MTKVTLAHVSDLHFGRDADLEQIEALEELVPSLHPDAVIISGDLTQRARHGEFQRALAFARIIGRAVPTLTLPGNHDVQWWASPFGIFGTRRMYAKYRRYFGAELSPRLSIPGAVIAGALTSHGIAVGSLTWNLNNLAVMGHLPTVEITKATRYFEAAPPAVARVLVVHHNVLPGAISRRMGLARWDRARQRLRASGADLILCGHDHQEGAGQIDGTVVVSTAGTHTGRTRGKQPSAFNVVSVSERAIDIQHMRWDRGKHQFLPADLARFGRLRVE